MSDSRGSNRTLYLGAATVIVAFLAGLGAGAVLFRGPGDVPARDTMDAGPPALFDALDLTPDQQVRIDSILDTVRQSTDSIMAEARMQLTWRATRARDAIEELLDPRQADQLEERFQTLGPIMVRRVRINDEPVRVDTIQ